MTTPPKLDDLSPFEEFLLANDYIFQDERELTEDHDPAQKGKVT